MAQNPQRHGVGHDGKASRTRRRRGEEVGQVIASRVKAFGGQPFGRLRSVTMRATLINEEQTTTE